MRSQVPSKIVYGFGGTKQDAWKTLLNQKKKNPDHIAIHVSTVLPTKKQPDVIAKNIVELALKLTTNLWD